MCNHKFITVEGGKYSRGLIRLCLNCPCTEVSYWDSLYQHFRPYYPPDEYDLHQFGKEYSTLLEQRESYKFHKRLKGTMEE